MPAWLLSPCSGAVRRLASLFDVFDPTRDRGLCSDEWWRCAPPGTTNTSGGGGGGGGNN